MAAKYLSRQNSKVVTIVGCGNQCKISLRALLNVRSPEKVFAFDKDANVSKTFANELSKELIFELRLSAILGHQSARALFASHVRPRKTSLFN